MINVFVNIVSSDLEPSKHKFQGVDNLAGQLIGGVNSH